jgi:quercetin dioxygenase-like cupin family protein
MFRIPRLFATVCLVGVVLAPSAHGQLAPASSGHTIVSPTSIQWMPAPPSMPPGAMISVLSGDPAKEGPFVMGIKFPDGWKVAPHWHPNDEHVTVLKGTLLMGMGEQADKATMKPIVVGGFTITPAKAPHYAMAKGETIIQVHGIGPFTATYVDPADDPRTKGKTNQPRACP